MDVVRQGERTNILLQSSSSSPNKALLLNSDLHHPLLAGSPYDYKIVHSRNSSSRRRRRRKAFLLLLK